jgi:hypothetical protein
MVAGCRASSLGGASMRNRFPSGVGRYAERAFEGTNRPRKSAWSVPYRQTRDEELDQRGLIWTRTGSESGGESGAAAPYGLNRLGKPVKRVVSMTPQSGLA